MRTVISRLLFCVVCVSLISTTGCGGDKTPTTPDVNAVQSYVDENPEVAARLDDDEEVEPDDDGSGEGE